MIILKKFSNSTDMADFKDSIICRTNPWIDGFHRPDGLYCKIKSNTIKVLSVENNYSLRGSNINICFYGMIIHLFKKDILLGYIGPTIIFTVFTLLVLMCPFEYIHIRIISLLLWVIVYLGNASKINGLREFILKAI